MSEKSNEVIMYEEKQQVETYRIATNAASLCRDIVIASSQEIAGKKYVKVEGWQAIAIAHGCVASAGVVERVETGYRAIGKVVRMSDGAVISEAEGFVGNDEEMWANRPEYARRAMAQTRAISRACRSAFAHVVVMMNAGLSTTPAEEVPLEGFDEKPPIQPPRPKNTEDVLITDPQLRAIHMLLGKLGIPDDNTKYGYISNILGLSKPILSLKHLTKKQAAQIIDILNQKLSGEDT